MRKQGKIISVPVTKVTEGMQVYYEKCTKVLYIEKVDSDKSVVWLTTLESTKGSYFTKDLKTLVVEYDEYKSFEIGDEKIIKQLPLKYSQWQAAIDNGEVDSDKIVDFEVVISYKIIKSIKQDVFEYAKVIPSKET